MDTFKNYLKVHTKLNGEEIDHITAYAISRKLRKNEFVLHEGDICRHKYFVLTGLLRTFTIATDGSEYIIRFSTENSWIVDKESYDLQTPAQMSICAVEPTIMLSWKKADYEKCIEEIPAFKTYIHQLTAANIYSNSQRLLTTLSATPEEKYQDFITRHPELLQRLPLKMIAAYLGISLRTLDRIRHTQLPHS